MGIKTDLIRYNVNERGRKHRGQDRNFDTRALAALINGPDVQERVKNGDLLGYYGHWPRLKLGMATQEGGVVNGVSITTPTAVRTIELRADPDGTIYHRAEFLDTPAGRIAADLFNSKSGGFSSAIVPVPGTMPIVPKAFHGFDYVIEPNYTTNRPYLLDGVEIPDGDGITQDDLVAIMDHVMAESQRGSEVLSAQFDALMRQHQLLLDTAAKLERENEELLSIAAKGGAVLDSVGAGFSAPSRGVVLDFKKYGPEQLPDLAVLDGAEARPATPESDFLRRKYGIEA